MNLYITLDTTVKNLSEIISYSHIMYDRHKIEFRGITPESYYSSLTPLFIKSESTVEAKHYVDSYIKFVRNKKRN